MFIKSLEVENWKCYNDKRKFKFKKHELITMKNGTGKTSLFQAIVFGITGKTPPGFNMNTVRNNPNEGSRVYINFDIIYEGSVADVEIERIFGSQNPLSELRINGDIICESVRSIEEHMNKIIDFKISNQLWTSSLVESDILKESFFSSSVLDDILKDPLKLQAEYKSKIYRDSRVINSFDDNVIDIQAVENTLKEIREKIKSESNGDSRGLNISQARSSKEAHNKMIEIEKNEEFKRTTLTLDDARRYNDLYSKKDRIILALEEEKKKVNSVFSNFNISEIIKIADHSKSEEKCLICSGEYSEKKDEDIRKEISLSGRSEDKIKSFKNSIDLLNNDKNLVDMIVEYNNLSSVFEKCKNYDEIISKFNKDNDKLWDKFDKAQKEHSKALRQQEELKFINELKSTNEDNKEKLSIISDYIIEASEYYTSQIMDKASDYLSQINSRYKQIALVDGDFHVVVENEDFSLNMLPVVRLSSGERTMCALSMLFAIHSLMVPELPLLFDETFAALDRENLKEVQNFLRAQDSQIFIITHDKKWEEF